ncbi:MAG: polysaccharide biosynthesis/export family protein [Gimesia sp.]
MRFLTATQTLRLLLLTLVSLTSGCAAFRTINGVPARYLAPELRAKSRNDESTIDLSLLAQKAPREHHVDGGDVLGIYIEGVLGRANEPPPINIPTSPDLPPSIGYPITVRDDGTLSLPMIDALDVRGMTIRQVEDQIRHIYTTERKILKQGTDRIIVSLQRPRHVQILVLRQETGGPGGTQFAQGLSLNLGQSKRGNGQVVHLPIYKNDVLHALAKTGGLPGLDAENTIYIVRREYSEPAVNKHIPSPVEPKPFQPAEENVSAYSGQNHSNIQLVGFADSPNPAPAQPSVIVYENNPIQNRSGQHPFGGQSTARCTIEPVIARNFGATNSLQQLRSVNVPVAVPMQEHYSVPAQETVYLQPAIQQRVFFEPVSQTEQPQLISPTPALQVETAELSIDAAVNVPLMAREVVSEPAQEPNVNRPDSHIADSNENVFKQYTDQPQVFTDIDLAMGNSRNDPTMNNRKVIKIPVRLKPGETPNIRPEDIILQDGDIVFIESRDTEIFYTGGLLGGGQYTLPRDYDLDILGAIAIAQGASRQQSARQIGGVSAMNGDVTISASSVIVLRQMPNGSQVPIKIDLYRALKDPAERILIQPGDIVMLRYKMHEAIGAFFERNLLESALFGVAASQMTSGN